MIILHYKLTEQEYLDYNFYTNWLASNKKPRRLIYYYLTPLLYLVIMGFLFYKPEKGGFDNISVTIGLIGLIALMLVTRFRIRGRFDKQILKMINTSPPDTVLPETELTISETGISGKTKIAEVKYPWNAFQKRITVNNCCYLYINAGHALVIPLRALKTVEEKEAFEKMLSEQLPLQAELPAMK